MPRTRVLVACSLGGAGHLNPVVPVLTEVRNQGHDVMVIGPGSMSGTVAALGFPFWPGGEPSEEILRPIREQLPMLPAQEASVLGNRELFGRIATRWMLPQMERAVAEWQPTHLVREPAEYASAVVAAYHAIPSVQVGISLAEVEEGSIRAAQPALEEHGPGLPEQLRAMPYWTRFPASLDPSPFQRTVRFWQPTPSSVSPLPDWWNGRAEPLVYLSFGTVISHMSFALDLYRAALTAVSNLNARVLFTVGHQIDPSSLEPLPKHVHVEQWVDQNRVLPEAAVVVSHGGSGTTFGALSAGVPVVVVPVFGDQVENGRRVVAAGVGLTVFADSASSVSAPFEVPHPARLTAAIEELLGQKRYGEVAQRVGAEMAQARELAMVVGEFLTS